MCYRVLQAPAIRVGEVCHNNGSSCLRGTIATRNLQVCPDWPQQEEENQIWIGTIQLVSLVPAVGWLDGKRRNTAS